MPSPVFVLDPFQLDAIAAVERGESVLVAAPTGSGKTAIAFEAIERALARAERAIYTTPVKALSNQKHRELAERLGADRTGLVTGDRSINPHADVVVMTTEVLRALLVDDTPLLDRVRTVVLDEFHYIQDPERGAVWEEIVMAAPADLTLVCLSATLPDAPRLHRWIDEVHPPAALVVTEHRPVPLHHHYAIGNLQGAPPLVMPMFVEGRINDSALVRDGARRALRGEGLRVRDRLRPVTPSRAQLVRHLGQSDLLPAIWFVLSRSGCDGAATELADAAVSLNTPSEALQARAIADATLASLTPRDLRVLNTQQWRHWLECGIAVHHSGHLPVQREAIEAAFAAGLVKLVFATETLAVGVNLPARTVVIDKVTRPHGQGRATISGSEFTQLAGRAGRRGLDRVGHVIVPWSPAVTLYEVAALAAGSPLPLGSQMRWTPALAAGLAHRFDHASAHAYAHRSLAAHLLRDAADAVRTRLGEAAAARERAAAAPPRAATAIEVRSIPAPGDDPVDLTHVKPGDVIVDPGRKGGVPLLVVDERKGRRGARHLVAVGGDARVTTVAPSDLRRTPVVVGSIDTGGWDPRERGQARRLARALTALDLPPVDHLPPPPPPAAREVAPAERLAALDGEIAYLRDELAHIEVATTAPVDAVVRLLTKRGHLEDFAPTATGHLVRRLFHPQGLLLAECVADGVFDGLAPEALAGVAAAFRAATSRQQSRRGPTPPAVVASRLSRASAVCLELHGDESECAVELTEPPDPSTARAMYRWASGDGLDRALEDTDLMPGDFVREVRQLIELLDQLSKAAPRLADTARGTITAVDRGTVRINSSDEGRESPLPATGTRW